MKILISYDNVLPHTTGNYFTRAFSCMADTSYIHPRQLNNIKQGEYDLHIKIDDGLYINRWNPNLHPSVYYIIDSHIDSEHNWRKDIVAESTFDHIFTAQKNGAKALDIPASWIPLGCDPELHSPTNSNGKIFDVCFIGNFHSEFADKRMDFVEALFKKFPNFFYGNRYFNEMAQKFNESRIVFNQALNNDINMRYFEACCSGSFQLASRITDNGLDELLEDGIDYVSYNNVEDMIDKAEYYIVHDDKREKIAQSGREKILSSHTYKHRAEEIIRRITNA